MITNRQALYDAVLDAIDRERETILHVADQIHARPEIAMEERFACDLLASTIERYDFSVERQAGGVETAFKARLRGRGAGPAIAFLAEYDALPGLGHGCGHNLIAGSNLAAAIGLSAVIDKVPGQVMLLGTPAEEAIGGKVLMIEGGAFDDVDVALSSHHSGDETTIATEPPQGTCLAVAPIRFEYAGRTAHAASDPHEGINALNAVIHLFVGLDALRQHVSPDVRIHGIITDGGKAPNIVPDYAAAVFYFRAATKEALNALIERGLAVAEGAASMTGARLTVTRSPAYDDVRPSYTLGRLLRSKLAVAGLEERQGANSHRRQTGPGPYSTDLGNVSRRVPTAAIQFAISDTPIRGHSTEVVECSISELGRENAIKTGKALALAALDLLLDSSLLDAARAEFAIPTS
ncbi:MAG TPA: amidohydrolase [Thermomicrobiales bacterium]|nr:amidohydrolase [Thermomicrobiales bacterium]